MEIQKGHSLVHWDALTSRGQRLWGLAVDDSHWKIPDFGGGWIVLKSEKLDQTGILESLKSGNFYSSSGPEIHDICIDGDQLKVACSPARSIYVIDQYHYSPLSVNAWGEESLVEGCINLLEMVNSKKPLTKATFTLDPRMEILRIEIVDFMGKSAWSNPYFKKPGQESWG